MKKFIAFMAMGAMVLSANAQKTVQGSGFYDNWSAGVVAGGITPTTHSAFFKNMRATYGVELTKQITPVFALGAQFMAANNVSESATVFDASNLSLLGKFNVSNVIWGYQGKPRFFEVEAVVGAGWGRNYYNASAGSSFNYMTTKYGFNLNFNLGKKKIWTLSLKPSIVYNMDNGKTSPSCNINKSAIELLAGATYHFKNKNNGQHYMTFLRAYNQGEIDALNAKINDLRSQVSGKDREIAKQNANIRSLQQMLNDARNQKPVVETITKSTNSMEQTVTFRQGKSTVDASQLPNIERIATFLKNHKSATVSIKGYASPEGSAEVNAKIANARAEAVKTILVNKYHIAANRIKAEGQGVGNMFSESDWNRVSICTINEAK